MQRLGAVATTAGGMRMTGEAALRSVCMPVHYCGLCKLLRDLLPCPACPTADKTLWLANISGHVFVSGLAQVMGKCCLKGAMA